MQRFDYEKLRAVRLGQKQTLEEVATATSITKQALSLIEAGESTPRLETILRISGHFGHPLEFFLTEDATTIAPQRKATEPIA